MTHSILPTMPSVDRQTIRTWMLIVIVLASLIYGSVDLVQGLQARILWLIGITGFLLGWLLARSRIQASWATAIGMLGGFGFVFLQVGRLFAPIVMLMRSLGSYLSASIEARNFGDPLILKLAMQEIWVGIQVLFTRLYLWFLSIFTADTHLDPIVLAMVWGLAIWGIAAWMSWAIRRKKQPIIASIPAIFVLGYSLAYEGGNSIYLLPMLAAVLFLTIFVNHDIRADVWIQLSGKFPQILRENLAWTAIMITAGLVTIAAITPSISIEDINDYYRKLTQDNEPSLEQSLGLDAEARAAALAARQNLRLTEARMGGLPRQHLIGSGPELSDQIVMVISAKELQPQLDGGVIEVAKSERNYYWRSLTYDRYNGLGWYTSDIEVKTYRPGELVVGTSRPGQHLLQQQIDLGEENEGFVYVAGSLVTVNNTFGAAWRPKTDALAARDMFGATIESNNYLAVSLLPIFSEAELRSVNYTFPKEITSHYLTLPNNISDRVISLASDLTATQPTLYDRAIAIESYLRTFEYDLDIPAPPSGENVEITDYFLFTLQRGYCDYYATAMVVLARAAGLPARFVQGYIGGAYDEVNKVYTITEDMAHSWVEIYFPDYGWVEFEPTAGRPSIIRPSQDELASLTEEEEPQELEELIEIDIPPFDPGGSRNRMLWIGIASLFLTLPFAAVLGWTFLDNWRLRRMRSSSLILEIYRRLLRYASRVNLTFPKGSTPHEIAPVLAHRLRRLIRGKRAFSGYNTLQEEISWLTEQFTQIRYSPHKSKDSAKKKAFQIWKRLRRVLWAARWETWRARLMRVELVEED